jgi:rod shape determining protein RodA
MQKNWNSNHFLHIDKILILSLVVLCCLGLVVLYSASDQNIDMMIRQLIHLFIGFGIIIIIAQFRTQQMMPWIPWVYLFGVILLVLVLLVGKTVNGSQRWLFGIQPSELMKLAVPMMVAWYLADKSLPPKYGHLFVAIFLIIIPAALVLKQPDLGTALLISASGIFVLLLAGLSWRIVFGVLGLIALSAPVLWNLLHPYQKGRILTLLNPERDPLGAGYHIIQSKIAIGSGGLYGKGWLNGTQSHLQFLPERHTDFIFAVYSEEFGLVGVLILLTIYFFIISRGMYIAVEAQDSFGRLLTGSLILTFFVYIFVNMGMVSGILPVVGVPLPFISYGGTAIVTLMAGFGLIMAVHTHRKFLSR